MIGRPLGALRERLAEPADSRGLAAFRIAFGLTMCFGALRFLWNGWVERFFGAPTHFFTYWGFEWVQPLPVAWTQAAFVAMAVLSLGVATGFLYRFSIIGFALLFTYVELIDATNYLNHYYLVSLTAVILAFLPAHARWSIDARLRASVASATVPRLAYTWLRFQIAVVWLSAALAKATPDWLLGAQPMNIWLNARVETPIVGPYFDIWSVALAASWAGFLYDATVPFLLMWRRTRPFAFVAVLGFHVVTHVLFNIGMFPLIMVVGATIFFDPAWPGRFVRGAVVTSTAPARSWLTHRAMLAFVTLWCALQIAMPLRFLAYGGDVLWHEQGMRWAFKVLCREKNGAVTFQVRLPAEGRQFEVPPRHYLTRYQEREMSGQPDMILRMAHVIAEDWRAKGHDDVEVYADAIASLNGRPPHRLINPSVNLAEVSDGLHKADWILKGPATPPPRIGR